MTQISNWDKSERAALIERLIQLHKQVQQAYALRDEHRLEEGKILLSLRTATPRGEWEPQLKELCKAIGMSRRTVHNYMNAAEKGAVTSMKDGETLQTK
jgi:AraC-like DNA-binding protein